MCNLSLDNGVNFIGISEVEENKERILTHWDFIVSLMDRDTMEEVNENTEADVNTKSGKLQYIKEYLGKANEDLVLG